MAEVPYLRHDLLIPCGVSVIPLDLILRTHHLCLSYNLMMEMSKNAIAIAKLMVLLKQAVKACPDCDGRHTIFNHRYMHHYVSSTEENMSSRCSSNSETIVSELLENLEGMFIA